MILAMNSMEFVNNFLNDQIIVRIVLIAFYFDVNYFWNMKNKTIVGKPVPYFYYCMPRLIKVYITFVWLLGKAENLIKSYDKTVHMQLTGNHCY